MNNDILTNAIATLRQVTNEMLEALGQEPLPKEPEIKPGTIVFAWDDDRPEKPTIGYYIQHDVETKWFPYCVDVYGEEEVFAHVAPVTPEDLA